MDHGQWCTFNSGINRMLLKRKRKKQKCLRLYVLSNARNPTINSSTAAQCDRPCARDFFFRAPYPGDSTVDRLALIGRIACTVRHDDRRRLTDNPWHGEIFVFEFYRYFFSIYLFYFFPSFAYYSFLLFTICFALRIYIEIKVFVSISTVCCFKAVRRKKLFFFLIIIII